MRAYFSFFPVMGVVLIVYALLNIYSMQAAGGRETENAQLLLDRMYFQRKDAEWNFWNAVSEKGVGGLEIWEQATELYPGTDSWVGPFLDAQTAFMTYRNSGPGALSLAQENAEGFLETGETMAMHSAGAGMPAIETVILNPNPRAATVFAVRPGDYLVR